MANKWAAELGLILIEWQIERMKKATGSEEFGDTAHPAAHETGEPARPDDTPATGAKQTGS